MFFPFFFAPFFSAGQQHDADDHQRDSQQGRRHYRHVNLSFHDIYVFIGQSFLSVNLSSFLILLLAPLAKSINLINYPAPRKCLCYLCCLFSLTAGGGI